MEMKIKSKLHLYRTIFMLVIIGILELLCNNSTNATTFKTKKTKFTYKEENVLIEHFKEYGDSRWDLAAGQLKGRTPRQCRERYLNYLSPNANVAPWTVEEERLLLQLHRQLGNKWALIAEFFPGRTGEKIRNRYYSMRRPCVMLPIPFLLPPSRIVYFPTITPQMESRNQLSQRRIRKNKTPNSSLLPVPIINLQQRSTSIPIVNINPQQAPTNILPPPATIETEDNSKKYSKILDDKISSFFGDKNLFEPGFDDFDGLF